MYDIILKKREGHSLSREEIDFFVEGYVQGEIPDYQVSALMMAIYFRKMNKEETADLTRAMVNSGKVMDLSAIRGIKVDKHSTGGVGDKTSLVLAPLVAAAGVPVAKMSGRGLGHTGGTIDKLESFPGFSVEMTPEQFINNVNEKGIAIGGQTSDLAPADKKLYALRDVTATVDDLSLIASSIMSKKIAGGADAIVLDVKTGSGAFMKDLEASFDLAREMVDIGTSTGKRTVAVVTDMDQPLGRAVGNILEVKEAIETLQDRGPADLRELCLCLGSQMLLLGGKAHDLQQAREILLEKLASGMALSKFRDFIGSQGGDPSYVDEPSKFPQPEIVKVLPCPQSGHVSSIMAEDVGRAALILGAGRETKGSKIDLRVGITLFRKVGDQVKEGDPLATIYATSEEKWKEAGDLLMRAYRFSMEKPLSPSLVRGIVSAESEIRY